MKKLTSTLGIFALAIGAAAAMAMSPAPKKSEAKSSATNYHWFRISDGTYLGFDSDDNKQLECGEQLQDCVYGYNAIDEEDQPVGNVASTLQGNKQL